jgi:agmatinase
MVNFGNIEEPFSCLSTSNIVILPVPYDETSTWIKGADKGPEAILEASANMELYDIETQSEVYRYGIFTAGPVIEKSDSEKMLVEVCSSVRHFLNLGKFVVTIGGEHSISFGPVKAYHEKYPGLSVLQLDAHTDLRQEYEGSRFNHACVMARIRELCPVVQYGIRSMDIEELHYIEPGRVFRAKEIIQRGDMTDVLLPLLSDNVYITIDLDVFDPSVMPSTGTPEPGGLDWYEVMNLLEKVIYAKNVVGFDVVELCPDKKNKAPDFLAAKLIYQLLSYRFNKNKKK